MKWTGVALVADARLGVLRLMAAITAVGAVLLGLLAGGAAGLVLLGLLTGLAAGIIFHELGHLTCAAVASIPVHRIVIGAGPLLWRGHLGEAWLELRLWPTAGRVDACPVMDCRWYRWALFLLGGVLGNLAVIGLVWGLYAVGAVTPGANQVLLPVITVQVLMFAENIIPFSRRTCKTDGMQLAQLLWTGTYDPAWLAEYRKAHHALLRGYGKGNMLTITLASSRLLCHVAQFLNDRDARQEAREGMLRELYRGELSPEEKMWVLDALVTDALVSGDPTVRCHLEDWSRQALALRPDLPTLRGSRGAALVELGRCAEGKALLVPLAAPDQPNSFDSFMSRAFLALAEHRLGNAVAARQFVDAARVTAEAAGNGPRMTEMLARLEREIPATAGGGAMNAGNARRTH